MSNKINPGYADFQLHQALQAANDHADPATRDRAAKRAQKWEAVIANMHSGRLTVGSRVPVKDIPAWMTLDVVTGGFATGGLAAGGDPLTFEVALAQKLCSTNDKQSGESIRQLLNYFFITKTGFEQLIEQVRMGRYLINAPEEGALLVAAWLANNGHESQSAALIEQLEPYFSKVRFYPQPSDSPQIATSKVFLRDVRSVSGDLDAVETPHAILAQREAIDVWQPLREEVFAFLLSTCDGNAPELTNQPGQPESVSGGRPMLQNDAHCSTAQSLIDQYDELQQNNKLCARPLRKNNLAQAIEILRVFVVDKKLSDSQINRLALLVTRYVRKRGLPGSQRHDQFRARQLQQIDGPLFAEIAQVVLSRLAKLTQNCGVEEFDVLASGIAPTESTERVSEGSRIPQSIMRKLERCMMDSTQALLERKVIKSSDSLAIVLPQVTGNIRAVGIACPQLRTLYAATYQAFRRRRSLLLLNYEHQVQIEELPWVSAIDAMRDESLSGHQAAIAAAKEIAQLAMTHFPMAIVPNKLLQEFRAIAKSAEIDLPLVDELAADIFMGAFTNKFVKAAHIAADLLKGSIYETYYQIDFEKVRAIKLAEPKRRRIASVLYTTPAISEEFAKLCSRRAVKGKGGSFVAKNGTVIEQQQVLTTQNLGTLLTGLEMTDQLRDQSIELAKNCFQHVCAQLQIQDKRFHARLIKLKNSAYAWRQMLVFLSLATEDDTRVFGSWVNEHMSMQSSDFQDRFSIAIDGLQNSITATFDGATMPRSHQPLLGWARGDHWFFKNK